MAALKFTSVIKIRGANPYIHVNKTRANLIKPDWRKPLPVLIRVNGKPEKAWQINMMPMGNGGFYLYLHGYVRKASDTKVGDRVEVQVEFDKKYKSGPMHSVPAWFSNALDQNLIAKTNWERLIPSRQKEVLRYFSSLKSQAAIERNLKLAMRVLSGKSGRFMARSWNKGK